MFDYACFDFILRSQISLPELPQRQGAMDGVPIVEIALSQFSDLRGPPVATVPELRVVADTATLSVPGVARYLIRGGAEILVDPVADASPRMVRLFLLGSALGILGLQRGLLLLHANAVVIDGGGYAFGGPSGAGKSTLAAHFQRVGHTVLCDDVCAVTFDAAGDPWAWPGLPRIKLWGDAAKRFGHDPATLDQVLDGTDKYQIPLTMKADAPVPLCALYILGKADDGALGRIDRLRGMASMAAVLQNSYRYGYVAPLGLTAQHFRNCSALVAKVRTYDATRSWGHDVFAREVSRIEDHIRLSVKGAERR